MSERKEPPRGGREGEKKMRVISVNFERGEKTGIKDVSLSSIATGKEFAPVPPDVLRVMQESPLLDPEFRQKYLDALAAIRKFTPSQRQRFLTDMNQLIARKAKHFAEVAHDSVYAHDSIHLSYEHIYSLLHISSWMNSEECERRLLEQETFLSRSPDLLRISFSYMQEELAIMQFYVEQHREWEEQGVLVRVTLRRRIADFFARLLK